MCIIQYRIGIYGPSTVVAREAESAVLTSSEEKSRVFLIQ
jgi:hypothetical protein